EDHEHHVVDAAEVMVEHRLDLLQVAAEDGLDRVVRQARLPQRPLRIVDVRLLELPVLAELVEDARGLAAVPIQAYLPVVGPPGADANTTRAASAASCSSGRQTRMSGVQGSAQSKRTGEPSSRETCAPAARATAVGAAVSQAYWPPAWTKTSASPVTTAAVFAPAEPSGTSSPSRASAKACANAGGRVRLTTMRGCRFSGGGSARGEPVERTTPRAGRATAPATARSSTTSATWTAQSCRPG